MPWTHILTSAERGSHLVNQLLALARNEPGGQGVETFSPLDLNRLAQECTMRWVPQALEKNIDLGFEDIPRLAPLRGDTASLTEMLNNLIDNAIRYTQAGGHITVSVNYEHGGAVLRVEDNGPASRRRTVSECSNASTACSAAARAAADLASPSWRKWQSATAPRSVWTRAMARKGR